MPSLKLSIDARGAKKGASDFDDVARRISRNAKVVVAALGRIERSVQSFTKVLDEHTQAMARAFPDVVGNRIENLRDQVRGLRDELRDVPTTVREAGQWMRTFGDIMPGVRLSTQTADTAVRHLNATLRSSGSVTRDAVSKYRSATNSINLFGQSITRYGRGYNSLTGNLRQLFGGFTVALGVQKSVSEIAKFEDVIAEIRAVAQTSREEIELLTAAARDIGGNSIFGAVDTAKALLALTKAGLSAREAIEALPGVLDFAVAGTIDIGDAAEVSAKILSQFGLDASETVRVIDTLAKTAANTVTGIPELANALKFVGPIASQLGNDVETVTAALGVLAQSGIEASLAGTNLRGILLALSKPTKEAETRIKDLGLSMEDVNPATKNIVEIFEAFARAQVDAADANVIFDRRQAASVTILTTYIDYLKLLTEENKKSIGFSKRAGEEIQNSLGKAYEKLKSSVTEATLSIGDSGLGGAARATVNTFRGALQIFAGNEHQLEDNAKAARILADSFELATYALTAFVAVKVYTYLASVAFGLQLVLDGLFALYAAVLANPWGALATAIAAVAVALFAFDESLDDNRENVVKHEAAVKRLTSQLVSYEEALIATETAERRKNVLDQIKGYEDQAAALQRLKDEVAGGTPITIGKTFELFPGLEFEAEHRLEDLRAYLSAFESSDKPINIGFGEVKFDLADLRKQLQEAEAAANPANLANTDATLSQIEDRIAKLRAQAVELQNTLPQKPEKVLGDTDDDEDQAEKLKKAQDALHAYLEDLKFERVLIGKNEAERRIATENRKAETLAIEAQVDARDAFLARLRKEVAEQEALRAAGEEREKEAKARKDASEALDEQLSGLQRSLQLIQTEESERSALEEQLKAEDLARRAGLDTGDKVVKQIIAIAKAIAIEKEAQENLKDAEREAKRAREEALREEERRLKASEDATRQAENLVESLELEAATIQETNKEREKAIALRQLEQQAEKGQIENLEQLKERAKAAIDLADQKTKFKAIGDGIAGAFGNALDSVFTQSENLGDALVSLFKDVSRQLLNALAIQPIVQALSASIQGLLASSGGLGGIFGSANGNVFSDGSVLPFANGGVAYSRNYFPMADGRTGLFGEAGAEAIMPLSRGSDGRLGVEVKQDRSAAQPVVKNYKIVMNVNARDADSFRRSEKQITRSLHKRIGR